MACFPSNLCLSPRSEGTRQNFWMKFIPQKLEGENCTILTSTDNEVDSSTRLTEVDRRTNRRQRIQYMLSRTENAVPLRYQYIRVSDNNTVCLFVIIRKWKNWKFDDLWLVNLLSRGHAEVMRRVDDVETLESSRRTRVLTRCAAAHL